jgi:hypothetical protein
MRFAFFIARVFITVFVVLLAADCAVRLWYPRLDRLNENFSATYLNGVITAMIALTVLMAQPAVADEGTVVVARGGSNALVLWDATPVVIQIVSDKTDRTAAMRSLEAQGLSILLQKRSAYSNAKSVTLRIIYKKTGAVSAAYGMASFDGIERLAEITATTAVLKRDSNLSSEISSGKVPEGVIVKISGAYPRCRFNSGEAWHLYRRKIRNLIDGEDFAFSVLPLTKASLCKWIVEQTSTELIFRSFFLEKRSALPILSGSDFRALIHFRTS